MYTDFIISSRQCARPVPIILLQDKWGNFDWYSLSKCPNAIHILEQNLFIY
jgi:hypothetical protein